MPAQAGPAKASVPGHPLALGRRTRAKLRAAVRALLDVPGLDGALDAVRLAVLVLASRTPAEKGVVEIRTRELGRWLGLSASYTASVVVPALRRSGVVAVEKVEGEFGQDDGLECRVLPLWATQGMTGHPMNLTKKNYATLWALMDALMAPGWTHKDGRFTPAGLLGTRTGRGAATDRLALLLLVVEARESGRVRLCGGTVDTKRGRAAATLARLLGCTASAGERVLERLEDQELVLRVRLKTGSGMPNRSRLMVPSVAAAHSRSVSDDATEDRAEAGKPDFSDLDVTARGSEPPEADTDAQVSDVPVTDVTEVAEPDVAAALHSDHPQVGTQVGVVRLDSGFSGEARGAEGRRPERVRAREDLAADGESAVAGTGSPVAEDGPLRGESPKPAPFHERAGQRPATAGSGQAPAGGWEKAQQQRRVTPSGDLDVRVALAPVSGLWERLSGWQQDQVQAATKAALGRMTARRRLRPAAGLRRLRDPAPRPVAGGDLRPAHQAPRAPPPRHHQRDHPAAPDRGPTRRHLRASRRQRDHRPDTCPAHPLRPSAVGAPFRPGLQLGGVGGRGVLRAGPGGAGMTATLTPFGGKEADAITTVLLSAVQAAGQQLLDTWPGAGGTPATAVKPDGSLVTDADLASEALLTQAIRAATPDAHIAAEENPTSHHPTAGQDTTVWFVDPLDGTRPYLNGSSDFAILLSAWRAGRPLLSIASFPAAGILATAVGNTPAFSPAAAPPPRLPVHVCYCDPPALRRTVPSHLEHRLDAHESTRALVDVARGHAAATVALMCGHRTWDIAAPVHLIMAAGGTVTDERGNSLRLTGCDVPARYLVAATTPALHRRLLAALNQE
ncbi:inositol monophosphatase family protein [Streptomyces sp. NPDC055992]|uniref:inositol monophosphatase family protein n=1 Tax=Streptomyces sp. NPDC055992 TaxID=3345673 RepID=UPI0035E03700